MKKKMSAFDSLDELGMGRLNEKAYQQLLVFCSDRISAREEERRSTAREIHDEIGQSLLALGMDVSLLKQKLTKPQMLSRAELFNELQWLTDQIHNTLETVHRVISNLRPETVYQLGLRGAIEWQAHEFQVRTGIPVEIQSDLEEITMMDPNDTTALFRIFQEALANVARHAMASRVEATIREDKEFFLMQIKDNGKGINQSDFQKTNSFGLLGLKERVLLLHGNVEIQGAPEDGTTVTVRIPLYLCKNGSERKLLEGQG